MSENNSNYTMDNTQNDLSNLKPFDFDIPESKKLKINSFNGSITIHSYDGDKIKVDAKTTTCDVDVKYESDATIVLTSKPDKFKEQFGNFDGNFFENLWKFISKISGFFNLWVDYEVWLPADVQIICNNKNGRYSVDGFNGKAHLETANGRIEIMNSEGDITALTYNGKIIADSFKGRLNANTYNGKVLVKNSELIDLKAETKNGRIMTHMIPLEDAKYSLKTMHGRIIIAIPEDSSIKIIGKTMNGKLVNRIKGEVIRDMNRKPSAEIIMGGGGSELIATTMNGSIFIMNYSEFNEDEIDFILDDGREECFERIEKDFDFCYGGPHIVFKDRYDKDNSEELKIILEMIKEGKISSEEGEKLIRAIK